MFLRALYTVILFIIAPFFLYGLYKKKTGKPSVGRRWKEHFGVTPPLRTSEQPIWIHAASVGEVLAITPLIKQIKRSTPDMAILLTTTTPTGAKQAESLRQWVEHRYAPLDFPFALSRFLNCVEPKQLLIVETELWPNMLHAAAKRNIPVHLVNARLSEKSYRGYRKIARLFKSMAEDLTGVICQCQDDMQRFAQLGVAEEKLKISGSIKFDISINRNILEAGAGLRSAISTHRPVWIAASTHQGEDEIILDAHKKVVDQFPQSLLILVPRHPERFSAVKQLAEQQFRTVARTETNTISPDVEVYIGDTMGEMLTLMGASDVCFMGGSLLGKKVGGHNLLEPAALGLPILTGPSFYNFTDITHSLCHVGSCTITPDAARIASHVITLITNPILRKELGAKAKQVVDGNRGALNRTLTYLNLN